MTDPSFPHDLLAVGLLPVLTLHSDSGVAELGDALATGGLRVVEVTLRTASGLPAIAALAADPRLVVGAGTVLDPAAVDRAVDAGARFVVSPGYDPDVVDRARDRGVAVLPGVATASEVQRAVRAGLSTCKFFPAEPSGGIAMLRALSGPFPDMRFVPSGGVTGTNVLAYLAEPNVPAVSGSWMVPAAGIGARDWSAVRRSCREAVTLVGGNR